ncbi:c-type cytochrome [Hyphomonas jannaschiana]|jgi:cytochrome c556|uniref:Putative cytochrome protein n=1 Tax=Hyphomonas jannaschiana VP2 TaxID=1280952 RepID=A0A059FC23_9PROT|nr:cytochrome c [Hyphomonas jannaschiana]KCZ88053.1 putative cytochrome protein [Hyphomonas jannaschiana VP2]
MKIRQTTFALAAIAGVSLLAACGGSDSSAPESEVAPAAEEVVLDNGMTPKEQIELRQGQLKKLGKAFKTISDQLKASEPDMAAIQAAAASVPVESEGMADWFPAGTGPDSGVKTDALPAIWEEPDLFTEKLSDFQMAAGALATAAETGDLAVIAPAFATTGGTCKSCHEKFRADD